MQTVVVATSAPLLLRDVILDEIDATSGNVTILAVMPDAYKTLKEWQLSPIMLRAEPRESWEQRDREFARLAMPGGLDFNLPGTELPAWKMLALDRLSFWCAGAVLQRQLEFIRAIQSDRVLVTMDLDHPLATALPGAVGVQCGSVRTREFYDLAQHLPYSHIITRDQSSADFFISRGWLSDKVESYSQVHLVPNKPDTTKQAEARRDLGLLGAEKVTLVIYESQVEWAFRHWRAKRGGQVVVWPMTTRAAQHLRATCPGLSDLVIDRLDLSLLVADEVVTFRYLEDITLRTGKPVKVYDHRDRWLARQLARTEL